MNKFAFQLLLKPFLSLAGHENGGSWSCDQTANNDTVQLQTL